MGIQQYNPGTTAVVKGAHLKKFVHGWAVFTLFGLARAHYYRRSKRDPSRAVSLCGRDVPAEHLYQPGNYPICALCRAKEPSATIDPAPVPPPTTKRPKTYRGKNVTERVLNCIKDRGTVTAEEVVELVAPSAQAALKELREAGLIKQTGRIGRTKLWELRRARDD